MINLGIVKYWQGIAEVILRITVIVSCSKQLFVFLRLCFLAEAFLQEYSLVGKARTRVRERKTFRKSIHLVFTLDAALN